MSGSRTVRLWSPELEREIDVQLSQKFWNWYDSRRRRYDQKYHKEDERIRAAYADFME